MKFQKKFELQYKKISDEIFERVSSDIYLSSLFSKNFKRYKSLISIIIKFDTYNEKTIKNICDYGCGCPFIIFILRNFNYDVVGYEPYKDEKTILCSNLLGMNKFVTDKLPETKFDLIIMNDVIEHLSIIKPIFQEINIISSKNGHLCVSTPNVLGIESWMKFLLRKTGHPQALEHYLNSDDNYTHHTREFTMDELILTLKFYGFKNLKHKSCINTLPSQKDINQLALAQGKEASKKSKLYFFYKFAKLIFPKQLNNNLFVIAQK